MNLFYAQLADITVPIIKLKGQESKHAIKVLRYRIGDKILITDGAGNLYHCKINSIGQTDLTAEIETSEFEERSKPEVILLLGLIKKRDRLEFAVEKCVELGADKIVIFKGEHSEKQNVREDRIITTALSAMKQSLRTYLPVIEVAKNLKQAVTMVQNDGGIIFADETENKTESVHNLNLKDQCTLIVGPEGGFSASEREWLKNEGAVPYSLGKKRLRTETAAFAMVDRFKSGLV